MKTQNKHALLGKINILALVVFALGALSLPLIDICFTAGWLFPQLAIILNVIAISSMIASSIIVVPLMALAICVMLVYFIVITPLTIIAYILEKLGAQSNLSSTTENKSTVQSIYNIVKKMEAFSDKSIKQFKHPKEVQTWVEYIKSLGTTFAANFKSTVQGVVNIVLTLPIKHLVSQTDCTYLDALKLETKKIKEAFPQVLFSSIRLIPVTIIFLNKYLKFSCYAKSVFLNKGIQRITKQEISEEQMFEQLQQKSAKYTSNQQLDHEILNEIIQKPCLTVKEKVDTIKEKICVEIREHERSRKNRCVYG